MYESMTLVSCCFEISSFCMEGFGIFSCLHLHYRDKVPSHILINQHNIVYLPVGIFFLRSTRSTRLCFARKYWIAVILPMTDICFTNNKFMLHYSGFFFFFCLFRYTITFSFNVNSYCNSLKILCVAVKLSMCSSSYVQSQLKWWHYQQLWPDLCIYSDNYYNSYLANHKWKTHPDFGDVKMWEKNYLIK